MILSRTKGGIFDKACSRCSGDIEPKSLTERRARREIHNEKIAMPALIKSKITNVLGHPFSAVMAVATDKKTNQKTICRPNVSPKRPHRCKKIEAALARTITAIIVIVIIVSNRVLPNVES